MSRDTLSLGPRAARNLDCKVIPGRSFCKQGPEA